MRIVASGPHERFIRHFQQTPEGHHLGVVDEYLDAAEVRHNLLDAMLDVIL